jgi:RNA polymerase sigma-70 factor (ECF subfamily)
MPHYGLTAADTMARLHRGDSAAARAIFDGFAYRLIGLARTRLNATIRQKVDPEDVVQSVFRSFFVRNRGGDFELTTWDNLWSLLAAITLRKCGHQFDYYHAARRDVARQMSTADELSSFTAIARDPTPDEAIMLAETVEQLMNSLDARDQTIVEFALQGEPVAEISTRVGCTQRTVQRVLKRVREQLDSG